MKTLKSLFASAFLAIALCSASFAADGKLPAIKKIIVKGNAIVQIIQKDQENVKIYEAYDPEKSTVVMKGNSLIINSNEVKPITVLVYAKDLFRIDASDNAIVQVKGQLNVPYLQVMLHDQAKANINAVTKGLYTVTDDKSRLKLKGISNEHISLRSSFSKLKTDDFACMRTSTSKIENAVAETKKNDTADYKLAMKQ